MTDAQLLAGFDLCRRHLTDERSRTGGPALHVAICRPEGGGTSVFTEDVFTALLGHSDYTPRVACSTHPPDCFAVAFPLSRRVGFVPTDQVNELIHRLESV